MPDLMTHTFLGLLLNRILMGRALVRVYSEVLKRSSHFVFLFLAGNILPDLASRAPAIIYPKLTPFLDPYHTLLGGLFTSYLCALFLEEKKRYVSFLLLFLGSVFHQVTDLLQKNIFGEGYRIFFPLELQVDIGFLWPEDSIYALLPLALVIWLLYRRKK